MRVFTYLAAALLAGLALQSTAVLAQAPPTRFYGTVTINGAPAPAGTEIRAYINGQECGAIATAADDGFYILDAAADATVIGCGLEDIEVTFAINGVSANEISYFTQGEFRNLDLSVNGEAPPVAPAPQPGAEPEPLPEE